MNYEKMWNTLKAESGYRWCQPHPSSMELLRIVDLMDEMEQRALEEEKITSDNKQSTPCSNCKEGLPHNQRHYNYCPFCGSKQCHGVHL